MIANSFREWSCSITSEEVTFERAVLIEELKRLQCGLNPKLKDTLPMGVAFHHAGLTLEEREVVERGFREGAISVLTATTTLAAGVNLPAQRVVIRAMFVGLNRLDIVRYRQMSGRAGRSGQRRAAGAAPGAPGAVAAGAASGAAAGAPASEQDAVAGARASRPAAAAYGECIIIASNEAELSEAACLLTGELQPVSSSFLLLPLASSKPGLQATAAGAQVAADYELMRRAVLEAIVSGLATNAAQLREWMQCTFLWLEKGGGVVHPLVESALQWLHAHGFIECDAPRDTQPTLGRAECAAPAAAATLPGGSDQVPLPPGVATTPRKSVSDPPVVPTAAGGAALAADSPLNGFVAASQVLGLIMRAESLGPIFAKPQVPRHDDPRRAAAGGLQFTSTQLGRAAFFSSMAPSAALLSHSELSRDSRSGFLLTTELHVIYHLTPYEPNVYVKWGVYHAIFEQLPEELKRVAFAVKVSHEFLRKAARNGRPPQGAREEEVRTHTRFFVALVLQDVLQELSISDVCEKFDLAVGPLQQLQDGASQYCGMVTVFCRHLNWWHLEALFEGFGARLSHGAKPELLPLLQTPGLGVLRARTLFSKGVTTTEELAALPVGKLRQLLMAALPYVAAEQRNDSAAARAVDIARGDDRMRDGGDGRGAWGGYGGGGGGGGGGGRSHMSDRERAVARVAQRILASAVNFVEEQARIAEYNLLGGGAGGGEEGYQRSAGARNIGGVAAAGAAADGGSDDDNDVDNTSDEGEGGDGDGGANALGAGTLNTAAAAVAVARIKARSKVNATKPKRTKKR